MKITKTTTPKQKPTSELGFGKYFSDHMLIINYENGKFLEPEIMPYQNIELDPAAMVLHYGQEIFEGLKAYRTSSNEINLFRPYENAKRMNTSAERLCMPQMDIDLWVDSVKELVNVERSWVPSEQGSSLYLRPFMIAVDPYIGVRASDSYKFITICSPVGNYYPSGINPVQIYVETDFVRAVKGGTGQTKSGGNYAASIKSQYNAKKIGYTQVLWLDGIERKYIEEVGTMNVFFVIDNEVITPSLEGSILPGITRSSCIELLNNMGYKVTERKISINEISEFAKNGTFKEMFGSGTAAVISPVGELNIGGEIIKINNNEIGEISQKLYDKITGIQRGDLKDDFNWIVKV